MNSYEDIPIEVLELIELPKEKRACRDMMREIKSIFSKIEPAGEKNRPPIIGYDPGTVFDVKTMGKDEIAKHFSLRTESGIRMISFNKTDDEGNIPNLEKIYVIADIIEQSFESDIGELIKYLEFQFKDSFPINSIK